MSKGILTSWACLLYNCGHCYEGDSLHVFHFFNNYNWRTLCTKTGYILVRPKLCVFDFICFPLKILYFAVGLVEKFIPWFFLFYVDLVRPFCIYHVSLLSIHVFSYVFTRTNLSPDEIFDSRVAYSTNGEQRSLVFFVTLESFMSYLYKQHWEEIIL